MWHTTYKMESCANVVLVQNLVISLLLSAVSCEICGQYCPQVGSVSGWDRSCNIESTDCRLHPVQGATPTAPLGVKIQDYAFYVRSDVYTLATNITWQLPENAAGLKGFVVHLIKTSYPVGLQFCKQISFSAMSNSSNFMSVVTFSLSCWRDLAVDSKYKITVTSLDSGQSVQLQHHTASCFEVPQVGHCLVNRGCDNCSGAIPTTDAWMPSKRPTAEPDGNQVVVEFQIYPGNYWLTYKVNLFSYELHKTPQELSKDVNTNGNFGRFTYTFENVEPGRYKALVKISRGDAYSVPSEDFVVMAPVTPGLVQTTFATTTKVGTGIEQGPTSKDLPMILGGAGAGILSAVLLVCVLVFWKRRNQRQVVTRSVTGGYGVLGGPIQNDEVSNNDVAVKSTNGQYGQLEADYCKGGRGRAGVTESQGCGESYLGSVYTDFNDFGCKHNLDNIHRDEISTIDTLANESGVIDV